MAGGRAAAARTGRRSSRRRHRRRTPSRTTPGSFSPPPPARLSASSSTKRPTDCVAEASSASLLANLLRLGTSPTQPSPISNSKTPKYVFLHFLRFLHLLVLVLVLSMNKPCSCCSCSSYKNSNGGCEGGKATFAVAKMAAKVGGRPIARLRPHGRRYNLSRSSSSSSRAPACGRSSSAAAVPGESPPAPASSCPAGPALQPTYAKSQVWHLSTLLAMPSAIAMLRFSLKFWSFLFMVFWITACSTVLVPARVVQALNLNLDEMGSAHPRLPPTFVRQSAHYREQWPARSDVPLSMFQKNTHSVPAAAAISPEFRLPPEWTY